MADEELERLANDLSRALVVVARVEAVLAAGMIDHPEIDGPLLSFAHEGAGAFEKRGMIAARARKKEWRHIGVLGVERCHAGPSSDGLVRRPRQARAQRCEVPDRVEAGRAAQPLGAPLQKWRETERSTRGEDPYAHATCVRPEILTATSDESNRGFNIARDLDRREAVRRAMIERNANDAAGGEMLAVRPKDAPVLRGRDDLFRRVAVDEEHGSARAFAGRRPVNVELEHPIPV